LLQWAASSPAHAAREHQRSRPLALLAKSLKQLAPSDEPRAREERDFLKSALAISQPASWLRNRHSVLRAWARAWAGIGSANAASAAGHSWHDGRGERARVGRDARAAEARARQ
jgi:hypothetical protein